MGEILTNHNGIKLNPQLQDVGYLTSSGKKAVGVIGEVMLVDHHGSEINMADIGVDLNASAGDTAAYIAKSSTATGGDFDVAYTAPTQLTFSNYPAGISAITAADIESIRQINAAGAVVATYHRDDVPMTMAGNVLTVPGATFGATDTFVVSTNVPRAVSAGAGGAGGGDNTYTNANNEDFTATVTNGAATITITGLNFTLEAKNVALGTIKKIAVTTGITTTLTPTAIQVSAGVITLTGIDNFVTGDEVAMMIVGPKKNYDVSLDNLLVAVQNPQYAHTTSVETLVSETNVLGYKATGDGGGDTDDIVDADGAFSVANIAENYIAYQTADGQSARILQTSVDAVPGVDSATNISTTTLSGAATWASKAYSLPQVKRYEINAEGYNHLSIHYRLRCLTFCNAYLKIYGTLDSTATVDADTGWVDLSLPLLGATTGITVPLSLTAISEDIVIIDKPTTMLKYMVKLVVESNSASPNTNSFLVYVKKSS